ncbi:FAD-binding protein [Brachybacterium sp. JHP9]|uniref:FAD-binding protein n=1 Tax=Brachybacterium equifaecis TaxID=2910770 RepID=A0ABT0QXI1_9MICO|nr:D-arabinono-1,4-lactone oxidase [Brachybacterium equifaecis]MCL6422385.1 FAD-binding protein [Brachybacterium equifaecis]
MPFALPPRAALEARANNWGGNHRFTPAVTVSAESAADVAAAVRWAIAHRLPVRPMGTGHSFSALVPTGGVLVRTPDLSGITGVDSRTGRVRVGAGTPLAQLNEELWEHGLALPTLGDADKQQVAGALATATHGTGLATGSLSSLMTGIRLITGTGEEAWIDESAPEQLRAARASLGALGVALEVELQAVPAFHLTDSRTLTDAEDLRAQWDGLTDPARPASFQWLPGEDSASLLELPAPEGEPSAGRALVRRSARAATTALVEGTGSPTGAPDSPTAAPGPVNADGTDRSYRVLVGRSMKPFHEMELLVPLDRAREAFDALTALLAEDFPEHQHPIEVRFVGQDDAHLSPTEGGPRAALSIPVKTSADYWPMLIAIDALLEPLGARPHWGKLHLLDRERVAALYPQLGAFQGVHAQLDPHGIFLNDHLRALLG